MHLVGRNVRGDGKVLQPRAHHREVRRREDDHLHGKQGKREGNSERSQILEALQQATPFGARESFHGHVKENAPHFFGNDIEREEIDLREVSGNMASNVLIKRGEYCGGITPSSPYALIGMSFT